MEILIYYQGLSSLKSCNLDKMKKEITRDSKILQNYGSSRVDIG